MQDNKPNIKHFTREELEQQTDYGVSKTQIVVDGQRYEQLSVVWELLEQ